MSPDAIITCLCKKAVVIIRRGVGSCSVCGKAYVLEAAWTPPPKPKAEGARSPG